ncbi:MAG: AAA family ATPase [Chloroflexi bacterium]|nr:AAA family ATPase [Chloroflexota bacterium]
MHDLLVGIVGPCAAGKSTLLQNLATRGIRGRHIAQEHSYVPDMWQRITHPDVLIFLDVSYPQSVLRGHLTWTQDEYAEQQRRLVHARLHADLYLQTDPLTPLQVVQTVMSFLATFKPFHPLSNRV